MCLPYFAAYIAGLCNESKESAVASLLACLPLLKPGNMEVKAEYLQILPKILSHSIDNGCHIEESRQLLSYSLIHPAMSASERAQFKSWLSHLEERFASTTTTTTTSQSNGVAPSPRPDVFSQFTGAKNGVTGVGGFTQSLLQGMSQPPPATPSWTGEKRDSGIIGDMSTDTRSSPSVSMLSSVPSGPRAITSSAACVGSGEFLQNGHIPLHMTHSGPPAFQSVPTPGEPRPLYLPLHVPTYLMSSFQCKTKPKNLHLHSRHVTETILKKMSDAIYNGLTFS